MKILEKNYINKIRVGIVILALTLYIPSSSLAEPSPMRHEYHGDPIISINMTYNSGPGGGDSFEGEIILELFIQWAPTTVNNFIELINQSFFDGIFYHRIIDDFVIQSGDYSCVEVGAYPVTNPDLSNFSWENYFLSSAVHSQTVH